MLLLGSSPVRDFKSFKHTTRLSVETDITYSFEYGGGVKVLGIHVKHDVGLFVEFVAVNILNSQACFSGLLNVELVGEVEEVGVNKAECL